METQSHKYIERGAPAIAALTTLLIMLESVGWQINSFTIFLVPLNVLPYAVLFTCASTLHRFMPPPPHMPVITSVVSISMMVFSCAVYSIFKPDAVTAVLRFWWIPLGSLVGGGMLLSALVKAGITCQTPNANAAQKFFSVKSDAAIAKHGIILKR